MQPNEAIVVGCRPCMFCGHRNKVMVSQTAYNAWRAGETIQKAMPELTAAQREMLISGTCSKCWDDNMKDDDDDDDD